MSIRDVVNSLITDAEPKSAGQSEGMKVLNDIVESKCLTAITQKDLEWLAVMPSVCDKSKRDELIKFLYEHDLKRRNEWEERVSAYLRIPLR